MATTIRDYPKLAADICDAVGKDNIISAAHCATRLRLVLKETPSAEVTQRISEMPAVIKVMESGGQYQVVIGTHAKDVYEALAQLLDLDENAADAPQTKQGIGSRIIATMSAVFAPFVYILAAAGLVQGALIIITHFAPAFAETGTYSVLSFISWTPFTFLPVMIAVTASKHFKCNTFIAMWCCLALVNSDWGAIAARIASGETVKFLAFPMSQTTYTSTVLPPLFLVLVLSYLERWLNKHLPDIIKALAVPFICTVIMVPLTILVIGPVSDMLATGIANAYNFLVNTVPALAAILVGGIWQVFVIFGVHWGVTPMCLANFANYGCDSFQAFQTCAVIAQAAACFGVFLKTRKERVSVRWPDRHLRHHRARHLRRDPAPEETLCLRLRGRRHRCPHHQLLQHQVLRLRRSARPADHRQCHERRKPVLLHRHDDRCAGDHHRHHHSGADRGLRRKGTQKQLIPEPKGETTCFLKTFCGAAQWLPISWKAAGMPMAAARPSAT